jgi:KipI family sensor histidine kinase inhibitor
VNVRAGSAAFYLYLAEAASAEVSAHVRRVQLALEGAKTPGVRDIVPAYTSILIEHEVNAVQEDLMRWAEGVLDTKAEESPAKTVTIPVCYGQDADARALEATLKLPWETIVKLHQGAEYTVAFTGFTPGFPYLLGLPEALHPPRRETPRNLPTGAVAIAGGQAGIYPEASPGGWWVLGRTDFKLFEPAASPPVRLEPGDRVRFTATRKRVADQRSKIEDRRSGDEARGCIGCLEVQQVWPRSASLQSLPRWGVGAFGLAQSGALDPLALQAGNRIVGNPANAPAVEVLAVGGVTLTALEETEVCVTGGGLEVFLAGRPVERWQMFRWPRGEVLELLPSREASGLTSYLCVTGGFAAACCRGSRSTDDRGQVGGRHGRYLRAGDVLTRRDVVGSSSPQPHVGLPRYPERLLLRLHPGPQYEEAAFTQLLGSSFRVAALDRMGVRLTGPAISLTRHEVLSEGSPWGALQLPPDGQPIILLADRGRTGGYAKPAVVEVRDLWRLAQARIGTEVCFEGRPRGVHREG